jgi:hypothetical protein
VIVHDRASCSEPHGGAANASLQIADIFRVHGHAYRREHRLSKEQRCAMRSIEVCRTAALGGHLDVCDRCGYQRPSYNSCRNRHCPKCQSLAQARWIEQRKQRILPTHHFHVVFTLPATLRALALANRRVVFNLLFQASSQTLLTLGRDPKRLGGMLGITAVLHTWTRALAFHPHLHCVVSGGESELAPNLAFLPIAPLASDPSAPRLSSSAHRATRARVPLCLSRHSVLGKSPYPLFVLFLRATISAPEQWQ